MGQSILYTTITNWFHFKKEQFQGHCWLFCWTALLSLLSSRMMVARASGFAPCSQSLTHMARVSESRPVLSNLEISRSVPKVSLASTILLPLPPLSLSRSITLGGASGIPDQITNKDLYSAKRLLSCILIGFKKTQLLQKNPS